MPIPQFPSSSPITLEMRDEAEEAFSGLSDGVAEFSFSGLYLFRSKYSYSLSLSDGALLVLGERAGKTFFATPSALPPKGDLERLLAERDEWKLISPSFLEKESAFFDGLSKRGFIVAEDKDNYDYLYRRSDLADLPGKAFHKKKNHVNAFIKAHKEIRAEPLTVANAPAAREVLDAWIKGQKDPNDTDFRQAQEALDSVEEGSLPLCGLLVLADGEPAAWCLAELFNGGSMATVHFEKARPGMTGAFQYINWAFARSLSEEVLLINREQDLGDEGLRQAKMTYRPCGFVKKYAARRAKN